jgi:nucleoside 2-deoxyribosyltransferase
MKLAIAGGFYHETCVEPDWHEYYGPGVRASEALSQRKVQRDLFCYCPENWKEQLNNKSASFDFTVHPATCPEGISFEYLHFLSNPIIRPLPANILKQPPIKCQGEAVLRYGFLEGDAITSGDRVVYDPQDAFDPKPYHENGSTAKELAIVCNLREGHQLTGETTVQAIATSFIKKHKATVAIVKNGSAGSLVASQGRFESVPFHITNKVHKIGSGDVFSAEYAYEWALLKSDPFEAAKKASARTAWYCENAYLPAKLDAENDLPNIKKPSELKEEKEYDVYLAGPFFNAMQRGLINEILSHFAGYDLRVFSPIHQVGEGKPDDVASADLKGLEASRFVFACLHGFDPGTVFEVGYARSRKVPVIVYVPHISEIDIMMFQGSGCFVIHDFATAIYWAAWWGKK